jgi:hypothetical protein
MGSGMGFVESVRRLTAPAGAVLAAAALCVACSSTTGGSPATSNPGGGVSIGGASGSVSVSVPVPSISDLPSISSLPSLGSGGGSDDAFCSTFNLSDLTNIGSSSDPTSIITQWDKLTAAAPSDIKPDFQKVDDYLHSLMSGQSNGTTPADLSAAGQHIGIWFAQNCGSN